MEKPARTVIQRLGGIRKAARIIGAPASTVQRWYESGYIPSRRQAEVMAAARRAEIELSAADFVEGAAA